MLILTRKPGETIVIGGNIRVKVIETKGGQVRIGVSAPRDVTVNREEIQDRIEEERRREQE